MDKLREFLNFLKAVKEDEKKTYEKYSDIYWFGFGLTIGTILAGIGMALLIIAIMVNPQAVCGAGI